MNCGTKDIIDKSILINFVQNGGIFYASDLTSSFLNETFPNIFAFKGSGEVCTLNAEIVDARLVEYIGKNISITFDMPCWSMLDHITTGKVIMKRTDTGKPLMVEVPYGKGCIYYTSFHNHTQASDKEMALLKILVLTQLSAKNNKSIKEIADIINFNVDKIKDKYGNNNKNTNILVETKKAEDVDKSIESIKAKWDKSSNVQQKQSNSLPDVNSTISKF